MKFLVLAACVCMAVAAPQRYQNAGQTATKLAAKAAVVAASPFLAAGNAIAGAGNAAYNAAKNVAYNDQESGIVRSESNVRPDGFDYKFETANGIVSESKGALKKIGDTEAVVQEGFYSYPGENGQIVKISYTADENGYQAYGDSLPQAPAIPEAIARSLVYNAAHPQIVEKY